uniref:Uncharacterized protein n=2 Tax=Oryza sativa subsp. japonica TaxID=39947 RepID=Q67U33_ORYSJ|nr:hypothetical protein [Oryza sativa Japonica Group]BAD38338.1 hypothetical protein [Oryza sativa Japonica Group]
MQCLKGYEALIRQSRRVSVSDTRSDTDTYRTRPDTCPGRIGIYPDFKINKIIPDTFPIRSDTVPIRLTLIFRRYQNPRARGEHIHPACAASQLSLSPLFPNAPAPPPPHQPLPLTGCAGAATLLSTSDAGSTASPPTPLTCSSVVAAAGLPRQPSPPPSCAGAAHWAAPRRLLL